MEIADLQESQRRMRTPTNRDNPIIEGLSGIPMSSPKPRSDIPVFRPEPRLPPETQMAMAPQSGQLPVTQPPRPQMQVDPNYPVSREMTEEEFNFGNMLREVAPLAVSVVVDNAIKNSDTEKTVELQKARNENQPDPMQIALSGIQEFGVPALQNNGINVDSTFEEDIESGGLTRMAANGGLIEMARGGKLWDPDKTVYRETPSGLQEMMLGDDGRYYTREGQDERGLYYPEEEREEEISKEPDLHPAYKGRYENVGTPRLLVGSNVPWNPNRPVNYTLPGIFPEMKDMPVSPGMLDPRDPLNQQVRGMLRGLPGDKPDPPATDPPLEKPSTYGLTQGEAILKIFQDRYGPDHQPPQDYSYMDTPEYQAEEASNVPFKHGGGLNQLARGGNFRGRVPGDGHGMEDNVFMPIQEGPKQVGTLAVSPKEYVVDAHTMSALGNGNADKGADVMDKVVENVRHQAYGTREQPNEINGLAALRPMTERV